MCKLFKYGCLVMVACSLFVIPIGKAFAQTPFTPDTMVRQKCSVCHKPDQQGRLEVIEETRKTPEEWINVVDRMIRLNGGPIEDENFFPVIKELSKHLILTPKEMQAVSYYTSEENSQYRETPDGDVGVRIFTSCVRCHAYGKIASHMKTPDQWKENMKLHIGYYPTTLAQMRELDWPKESDELADILAKMYPYDTPEWREWMKNRKDQDITGTWQISGYQPGFGFYEGEYVFTANPKKGEDEYRVTKEVRFENGTALKMAGEATLYGEYHLRYKMAPTALTGRVEGVFDLNAETMGFKGKWWTVVQDTNGHGNEEFYKTTGATRVFGVLPLALKADGSAKQMTLIGVNLPKNIAASDVSFGNAGIKVEKILSNDATKIVCHVLANESTPLGQYPASVKNSACNKSLTVYPKMDFIKIFPELGRARVSCGAAYPPHGVQFVAMGMSNGKDGKPGTEDDIMLNPVDADWELMEEKTRDNDDDLKYLNTSIINGLYTPITTYGPIAERHQNREGVGLIAVGASYTEGEKTLTAKSLLAVTVTDFVTHIK